MADQAAQQQQPGGGSSGGTSSNAPVRKECSIPGKACWVLWRTNFEIDLHYQPIKAIGKGAYGVVCRSGAFERRGARARLRAPAARTQRRPPLCGVVCACGEHGRAMQPCAAAVHVWRSTLAGSITPALADSRAPAATLRAPVPPFLPPPAAPRTCRPTRRSRSRRSPTRSRT